MDFISTGVPRARPLIFQMKKQRTTEVKQLVQGQSQARAKAR